MTVFRWLVRLAERLDESLREAHHVEVMAPEPGPGLSLHCGHTVPLADRRIGDDGLSACSRCAEATRRG